jgi:2-polyprenyl-3-methyl-5-hydroxy-6-metoxy-1,4-benzoquinol methylase
MIENNFGIKKRLEFIEDTLRKSFPRRVLDMGCGTGAQLTIPLAERLPDILFVGADSDSESISFARKSHSLPNLDFVEAREVTKGDVFDFIILADVIEHVEDPEAFLSCLHGMLVEGGKLIITMPNGHGPFEAVSFAQNLLQITPLYGALLGAKRAIFGTSSLPHGSHTLSSSPHINFFTYSRTKCLFQRSGFKMIQYRSRVFVCGFFFDQLMRSEFICEWNAKMADYLPPQLISSWMFLLERVEKDMTCSFRITPYEKFRRSLINKVIPLNP